MQANIVCHKFLYPSINILGNPLYEHIYSYNIYEVGYYNFPTAAKGGAAFFPRDATVDIMQLII